MMSSDHDGIKRIYLWANIRSLGTIFLKWLSNVPDIQIINGIFTSCYYYGAESTWHKDARELSNTKAKETNLSDFPFVYDASTVSYTWAKTQLECAYPGKKYLVCKDQPPALSGNYDLIPKGFRHTFLMRHPYRMYPSWKKVMVKYFPTTNLKEIIDKYYYCRYSYKEQYELLQYLQKHPEMGDPNPVVIDGDDLLNHPALVLSQYCQAVGIPFTDDMLTWNPGTEDVKNWTTSIQMVGGGLSKGEWGYYRTAMESTQFRPPKKLPTRNELKDDVLECADIGMPFYEKLYDMRTIRP